MRLTFLGTSSGVPCPTRNVTCIALTHEDGNLWIFDCGEGTQHQFMRAPAVKSTKITKIFLTHLHGDHSYGLPGLLCTSSNQQGLNNRETIEIYGPIGVRKYLRTTLGLSESHLNFKYKCYEIIPRYSKFGPTTNILELEEHEQNLFAKDKSLEMEGEDEYIFYDDESASYKIFENDKYIIRANRLDHRIFCVGYSITEKDKPGALNVQKLQALGVKPGPLYSTLKSGKSISVTTPVAGTNETTELVINPEDVMGPPKRGRKLVVLGDTCDSTEMLNIGAEADVVVHEATLDDSMRHLAVDRGHSTPSMAGEFARALQAKKLILTHFSQRFQKKEVLEQRKLEKELKKKQEEENKEKAKNNKKKQASCCSNNNNEEDCGEEEDKALEDLVEAAKKAFGSDNVDYAEDFKSFDIVAHN